MATDVGQVIKQYHYKSADFGSVYLSPKKTQQDKAENMHKSKHLGTLHRFGRSWREAEK
jgi:hypothetical protein